MNGFNKRKLNLSYNKKSGYKPIYKQMTSSLVYPPINRIDCIRYQPIFYINYTPSISIVKNNTNIE